MATSKPGNLSNTRDWQEIRAALNSNTDLKNWDSFDKLPPILFRIIILQFVGLVLTYNFTNCDYQKIRQEYENVIYRALKKYMNGIKSTRFNQIESCYNPSDCLTKIERYTFNPTSDCLSLSESLFALRTKATLVLQCSGYSGIQINNTQKMKQERVNSSCLNQTSQILGWWRRFCRF